NALNFQWLWPYYPTYLLAGAVGELAAFNLCILAGLVLSAAAMYLLVRWLGCGRPAAAWSGLAYALFPWHLQRAVLGNGSLVHIEIFPLLLLVGLAWLRRPTHGRAVAVALAVTAAWLTSGYFGTIALVAVAGVSAVALWVHRAHAGTLAALRNAFSLWALTLLATGVFALVAIATGGTTNLDLGRSTGEIAYWG